MKNRRGRPLFRKDEKLYRRFLIKFSKDPVFTRSKIECALKGIYKTYSAQALAYVAIVEHRLKVEHDLKRLERNSNAPLVPFDKDQQQYFQAEEEVPIIGSNLINTMNQDLNRIKNSLTQLGINLKMREEKKKYKTSNIPPCPKAKPITLLRQKKLSSAATLVDLTLDEDVKPEIEPVTCYSNLMNRKEKSRASKKIPVITL